MMLAFNLSAAEVLILTPKSGVHIGVHSTRLNFASFRVEFLPDGPPTNLVTLIITNDLLTVDLLKRVPSGRGLMGVRSLYKDGEESEVTLIRYDLRREKPPAPSLTPVGIGTTNQVESSLSDELRKIRSRRVVPMPPMPGVPRQQIVDTFRPPLPDGTNRSYSQFLDSLADRKGKRRSE